MTPLSKLYSFEEYTIYVNYFKCIENGSPFYPGIAYNKLFVLKDTFPSLPDALYNERVYEKLYTDNKELLETAKKIYIHPTCEIPRSLITTKYKKVLNPWDADAVALPDSPSGFSYDRGAWFINTKQKEIVFVNISEYNDTSLADRLFKEGVDINSILVDCGCPPLEKNYILFNYGKYIYIPLDSPIPDVLSGALPASKIVYESSLRDSLGNDANKPDVDTLLSIREMLLSSDTDTVGTGLKALATLDWMHYPESVKYIVERNICRFLCNKAAHSANVKYMFSTLKGYGRYCLASSYNIELPDYELYKQLVCYIENIDPSKILEKMRYLNFMTVDKTGSLVPKLK